MNFLRLELEEERCDVCKGSWGTELLGYIGDSVVIDFLCIKLKNEELISLYLLKMISNGAIFLQGNSPCTIEGIIICNDKLMIFIFT